MKSFKEYITETPIPDYPVNQEKQDQARDDINMTHDLHHDESRHLEDTPEGSLHCYDDDGYKTYYHLVNNKPREFMEVDDKNNVLYSDKNGGNSDYNKRFMQIHARDHGELNSDTTQSRGGQKLWLDLIRDGHKVFHQGVQITPDNLPGLKSKIWDKDKRIMDKDQRLTLKP